MGGIAIGTRTAAPERWGREEYRRLLALQEERRYPELYHRALLLLEGADTGLLTRARTHDLLCWLFAEGWRRPAPEALFHGEEAIRLAERLGEGRLRTEALFHYATAAWQLGHLSTAADAYREALTLLRRTPALIPHGPVLALQGLARVALLQGDLPEALRHLEAAETQCPRRRSSPLRAEVRRLRSLVLLKEGKPQAAADELRQAEEAALTQGAGGSAWRLRLLCSRADVAAALSRWSVARSMAGACLALAQELEDLGAAAEAHSLLALAEQAEGKRSAPQRARLAITTAIRSGRRDVLEAVRSRLRGFLTLEG